MASPGTDAAEGDGRRTAASSARATGWRVRPTRLTESAIPQAWLEPDATQPRRRPSPGETPPPETAPTGSVSAQPGAADDHDAPGMPPKPRRPFSLRLRRRERAAAPFGAPDPVGLDLVAMGLDDEDDRDWSELTLASLAGGVEGSRPGSPVDRVDPAGSDAEGPGDDPWSLLADDLERRELQAEIRARTEREHAVLTRRSELEPHPRADPAQPIERANGIDEPVAGEAEAGALELEHEFWTEGSTMAPVWLQRRKHREEHDMFVDDEPMEMLDLSAYDVPQERLGAFREAVAAGGDAETDRDRADTAPELPS